MERGVFLDRDGVLTELIYNTKTKAYEAPQLIEDLKLMGHVFFSIDRLKKMGFKLFLASNQPDYAKGKSTLPEINKIGNKFKTILEENNLGLDEYYYCYHHPEGIVPEYTLKCRCRKPGILFLEKAEIKYDLDLKNSWFIGDRDTDIICGKSAGTKTILIENPLSKDLQGNSFPDFKAADIKNAVAIIENEIKKGPVHEHQGFGS
jgi:D-glycero-D-manno-heptose 1,7-bisphosphate phosphatase